MRLKDKIALITGVSRGIGQGIAIGYAKEGADIIIRRSYPVWVDTRNRVNA
jgi:NAD(P)-dependent dehydrogenase (short-subunit alcohol dehydrogenase family)